MFALDDLVQSLQAAVHSTSTALGDGAQAENQASEARRAAAAFGRDDDVAQVDLLRSDMEANNTALGTVKHTYEQLLERAVTLQGSSG